jgi:hypothetical protein
MDFLRVTTSLITGKNEISLLLPWQIDPVGFPEQERLEDCPGENDEVFLQCACPGDTYPCGPMALQ